MAGFPAQCAGDSVQQAFQSAKDRRELGDDLQPLRSSRLLSCRPPAALWPVPPSLPPRIRFLSIRAEGCRTFDARDRTPRSSRATAHYPVENPPTVPRSLPRERVRSSTRSSRSLQATATVRNAPQRKLTDAHRSARLGGKRPVRSCAKCCRSGTMQMGGQRDGETRRPAVHFPPARRDLSAAPRQRADGINEKSG